MNVSVYFLLFFKTILFTITFSFATTVIASEPCPPGNKAACESLGGEWIERNWPECSSCSELLPLVFYDCKSNADCKPCGKTACYTDVRSFNKQELRAIQQLPGISLPDYSTCGEAGNQTCGCIEGHCKVVIADVECKQDTDCQECCGSCMPTRTTKVIDCKTHCLKKERSQRPCKCNKNRCS